MSAAAIRIAAGIITYQDGLGLERCIRSLSGPQQGIDKVIVVDGRYPDYGKPTDPKFSTDGTDEIIKRLQYEKVVPELVYTKLFASQPEKRSKYLELASDCQFLLVIDCDEIVVTKGLEAADWSRFRESLALETSSRFELKLRENKQPVHNIDFRAEPTKLMRLGRLFYQPSDVYYTSHWRIARRLDNAPLYYPPMNNIPQTIRGIVIAYVGETLRSPERMQLDIDYQWELEYKEGDLTEQQFKTSALKQRFLEHNVHEARAWEKGGEAIIESIGYQQERQPSKRRRDSYSTSSSEAFL